jgi:hypothetical protein
MKKKAYFTGPETMSVSMLSKRVNMQKQLHATADDHSLLHREVAVTTAPHKVGTTTYQSFIMTPLYDKNY